jgi:hypothetical protein
MSPLSAPNNLQHVGPKHVARYMTLQDAKLAERQMSFARKVVQETATYDNIYYEVCNEPSGELPPETTLAEVNAWQAGIAKTIREEENKLGTTHMVFVCPVVAIKPKVVQVFDDAVKDRAVGAVNFHTHGALMLGGKTYNIGGFMTKELSLGGLRDFCAAMRDACPKPFVLDEDNAASAYKDDEAWTIERKRGWTVVMNGGHYDFIDFSITVGHEAGTPESGRKIRTWMKNLSEFVHSFDFVHAKPQSDWLTGLPQYMQQSTLTVEGNEYVAYIADTRERADSDAGKPIGGRVSIKLAQGDYVARFYSPVAGQYSPGIRVKGGDSVSLELPEFSHDLVLRVTRKASGD